ncbi:glyoxalase [Vibrio sp. vnigr-6D03]|uniref:VOC family protein n=1 Tax=Vibrio sp. vnigr-6D03 TaxID=2058088 RepID=UPI000C34A197|nr:VOC family protein [Vibrio sp. vnigr-6D03]PKF80216.1 glyoxalase [Vibrio sp. vnigr-6D03]
MIEVQAMFPVMVSENLAALKDFYQSTFGFTAVFYDSEFYLHLVSENGVQLGFLVPEHATQPEFLHPVMAKEGYVISLEVADARSAYEWATKNELTVAMPLKEEVWGQVHFMVEDPAGFKIDIVEHVSQ